MTRYNIFEELGKILELKKTEDHAYNKIVVSGELRNEHCDYGIGFYDVSMYYLYMNEVHYVRVWFGTADDGDFGSWNECKTKEKAIGLLDKIVDKFRTIIVCPSSEELNREFKDIGVQFIFE